MEGKSKYIQVSTTVATKSDALKIAHILANKKLSACTQMIGPILSIYKWKEKLEQSKEWLCVVKTEQKHYKAVEKAIRSIHPYELPEVIATPIVCGSEEYLEWVTKQV